MNTNQQKILDLAGKKDISKMGFREIGREIGILNPQLVIHHLGQLKKKGLLYFDSKSRQRVAKPKAFANGLILNIPILGSANAGPACELAQENIEGYIRISTTILGKSSPSGLFAVKVSGNSMNNATEIKGGPISNGDYIIIDSNKKKPGNGDYVLSIFDDAANIKRYYKNGKEIKLVSESTQEFPPIVLHESDIYKDKYLINGVALRVVKNNFYE